VIEASPLSCGDFAFRVDSHALEQSGSGRRAAPGFIIEHMPVQLRH
jgi:hypothetical protein